MPSEPAPSFLIRPPDREPYAATLDQLTALVRAARELRMAARDDMKAKRLQAMAVVRTQTQANSDMFDRVIAAGEVVSKARQLAETAHMGILSEQIADLKEMTEDLHEFGQAAPPLSTEKPATGFAAPSVGVSPALQALQATVPKPNPEAWKDGSAYTGTHPDEGGGP